MVGRGKHRSRVSPSVLPFAPGTAAVLTVREGRAQVRLADRVDAAHGDGGEVRAVVAGALGPAVQGPQQPLAGGEAQREYGWTSNRAIARQLSARTSGGRRRATRWRGTSGGTGSARAAAPSPTTASAASRTRRTASAIVVPVWPSGTARPARDQPVGDPAHPRPAGGFQSNI
ncbi:hypothetical protein SVIOM74S_07760 [Streptomyces violarus]